MYTEKEIKKIKEIIQYAEDMSIKTSSELKSKQLSKVARMARSLLASYAPFKNVAGFLKNSEDEGTQLFLLALQSHGLVEL